MSANQSPEAFAKSTDVDGHPLPPVDDHRVFLFFPFTIGPTGQRQQRLAEFHRCLNDAPLSRLAGSRRLPAWVQDKAASIDGSMWLERCRNVTADLHPHVRRLAGGDAAAEPAITRCRHFELSPEGVNLLTGRKGATGLGLTVRLSHAAAGRLGVGDPGAKREELPRASVFIKSVTVQVWHSGIGFLVMELRYECEAVTDQANLILEMNHGLCRVVSPGSAASDEGEPRITWQRRIGKGQYDKEAAPTLDELALELLDLACAGPAHELGSRAGSGSALFRPDWPQDHRLFAYSFVAFRESIPVEARDRYLLRLSHRYTLDYAVALPATSELYRPFDTVAHAASVEGGAVVVDRSRAVPFLDDFLETAVRDAYLPLALVSLHEVRYLLRMSQESVAHAPEGSGFARQIRNLTELGREMACFKLYYRFSQASHISHHNEVHQLWRSALRLGRVLDEATADVEQAHRMLSERRWRVYGTLGTFFVAYLSLTHIVNLLLDTVLNREDTLASAQVQALTGLITVQQFDALRHAFSVQQQIGYVLALLAAAGVAALVFKIAPSSRL